VRPIGVVRVDLVIAADRTARLPWLAACLALCLLSAAARAEGAEDGDARREQADALLDDEAHWPEAIAIYRALLAEDPNRSEVRHQLARVLSWRGEYDESIALFDALLTEPAPPPDAAVERAEVLSWAGRSAEARAAFEAILAAHPDDARAARGLARTYRWSGQRTLARRWYVRALAAEEDADARGELAALDRELQRQALASLRYFRDSDDFALWRTQAEFAVDLDFDTRLRVSSGSLWASQPARKLPRADMPDDDRGFDAVATVERQLATSFKGTLALGARSWEHGGTTPLARGALELSPDERSSYTLELRHDDLLERSMSLASALRGYSDSELRLSAWRQLAEHWEGYLAALGGLVSDGNGLALGETSVAYRPWSGRDVAFGIAAQAQHYGRHSDFYYTPDLDLEAMLTLSGRLPIHGPLAFTFDLGGGGGRSEEQGNVSWGPGYRVKLGLRFDRGGWSVALDGERSQSQREVLYTTNGFALSVGRTF
jgi:tetratricopeptide (TPR) repeat protein